MPRLNGLPLNGGTARAAVVRLSISSPAAAEPPVRSNVRRLMRPSQLPVSPMARASPGRRAPHMGQRFGFS
jgi:hypothetical protein